MELYQVQKFQKKISSFLLLIILKLIVIQIIIGAFLSGLDGGLIYNTWPGMNGNFFPDDINLKDALNFQIFNNVSIIQFLHRFNAYFLLFFVIILNYYFFKKSNEIKFIILFDLAILIQIILGVITLVSGVEIKYASLHQLGSIFVLSSYLLLFYKNSS
jgi:cytochrome c oxidase assembly protein subunit 15